ncbi:MAG: hypothetical protein ACYTHM_20690, partial [Planctomycetota bacterium]
MVTLIPQPPSQLIVPANSITGNYALFWSAAATANQYELHESFNGGAWLQVYLGAGTSWAAVGVPDGNYNYRVRSGNLAGFSNWTYGSYQSNPPSPPMPGDTVSVLRPPAAPATMTVPFTDADGTFLVSWAPSTTSGVAYRMQEDTDPNFGAPIQLYLGLGTSFTVGGGTTPNQPRGNGTYFYRVRSENAAGSSGWTYGTNGCTVLLPPPPAPTAIWFEDPQTTPVVRTVASPDINGDYWVTWNASPGATGYELQEATNPTFAGAMTVYLDAPATHHVQNNPGLPPSGVTYYYRVRAQNSSGWSPWLNDTQGCHVEVPVPGNVPSVLIEDTPGGGPAVQPNLNGNYFVTWTAATGAAEYEVEEAMNASFAGAAVVFTWQIPQTGPIPPLEYSVTGKPNGAYYYRVRGKNTSGPSGTWTTATNNPITVLLPPPAPGALNVPATSSTGTYQLTWTSSPTAMEYELQESMNAGPWVTITTAGYANTFFDISGRSDGIYTYQVRAINSSGISPWTAGSNPCTVLFPPLSPQGINVPFSSSTGDFTVTWIASPSTPPLTYELEESDNSQASWTQVYTGQGLSFNVTGKVSGLFWYRVRAVNTSGPSAWLVSGNGCQIVAPPTPTNLFCPSTSAAGTWTVTWSPSAGATGYVLEESDNGGMSWTVIYRGPNTSYTVTGKISGTFLYRVSAENGAGTSSPSATVSCTMVPPNPPTSITVPPTSISGYFTVSWATSLGATSYALEESSNGGMTWSPVTTGGATSFYVTDRQGTPTSPVTYWYRVSASNAVGSSTWTQSLNGCQVALQPPGAPSSILVPATSQTGSFQVSWAGVWGATGYELQESMDPMFGSPITVYVGSATDFTIVGKGNGIYYYQVRATNPAPNGVSSWTQGMNGCQVILQAPGVPGSLLVPFSSFSGIYSLDWSMGPGAMWYEVQEDTDPAFPNPHAVYLGGNTSCVLTGRDTGTYHYRVRSVNTVGVSSWVPGSNPCTVAVVSASLGMFPGPANPLDTREVPGAMNVPMLQLGMAAGTGGAILVEEMILYGSGTGNEMTGVLQVRLWEDVDKDGVVTAGVDREIGSAQSFPADDGAVTFTGLNETIDSGDIEMWLVTYDFMGTAVQGEFYQLELVANGDVTASDPVWGGSITPSGASVIGGRKTLSTIGAGDLEVFVGGMTPAGATVAPGTQNVAVAQFNIVASSLESVDISEIRVWA